MATPLAVRAFEYHLAVYRRVWRGSVVTAVVTPVLFLAAIGFGLGQLVDQGDSATGLIAQVGYAAFLAPGLLAATAMQVAGGEATWPVMGAFKWAGSYKAQAATPLGPVHIALGHQLYLWFRALLTSALLFVVIVAFGAVESWWGLLAVPAATLTGAAFAAPVAAYAITRDSEISFSAIQRFVVVPMFLFAGTFFPIDQLPGWMQVVARVTPLWHGVELCRGLCLGLVDLTAALVHVAYLLVWAAAGVAVACFVTYPRRLAP
jgi:lipooligosaccharide transport system permease protein